MSLIPIMNMAGKLDHIGGSPVTGGVFVVTSIPALKVSAVSNGVYAGELKYLFSGGSAPGFVSDSLATLSEQSISPTAVKARAEGELVIRLGDSGMMVASGTLTSGGAASVRVPVEVSDAGQDKVTAQ